MTEYEAGLPVQVAFPPEIVRSLADAVADAGWRQFHVAETEKYAHVTYFFNGGLEAAHPGEERRLIPSRKVATYDLAPEMSATGVTDALVEAIGSGSYDVIVANYANADMVGHTGALGRDAPGAGHDRRLPGAGRGRDRSRGRRTTRRLPARSSSITADHGNADQLRDADGHPQSPRIRSTRSRSSSSVGPRTVSCSATGSSPTSRRRCSTFAGLPRWEGMTGRSPHPVIASVAVRIEVVAPVNPLLAFGQIIVSIALIIAILLQARGTGLSGTFGGDSAVYRSRRGVERRLWQFTIVLLVLFVVFSLASFLFAPVVATA